MIELTTNSHLFAKWFIGIPLTTLFVYIWFRGFCICANNACCRIIKWQNEGPKPRTVEEVKGYEAVVEEAHRIGRALEATGMTTLGKVVLRLKKFKPFQKAGLEDEIIAEVRTILESYGVTEIHTSVEGGFLYLSSEPIS